jgi:hypothetical protein
LILTVTVRAALNDKYGASGYQDIRRALNGFAEIAGGLVFALDDPVEMNPLGVPALAARDPGSILLSVRAIRQRISGIDSLLIAGGDDVVPFWKITNPVTDRAIDPDPVVATDNPYGANSEILEEYLAPVLPVGRLHDYGNGTGQAFVDLISAATTFRNARPTRSGSGVVINRDWSECGHKAAATLPEPVDWHITPGYVMSGGTMNDTDRQALYFNLHGFSGLPQWKGYDPVRGQYVAVVTPEAFDRRFVSGSVVFAENCYGAQTIGRNPKNSCALRLVQERAAFIGATGLAFGSHLVPRMFLEDADLLAQGFFAHFWGRRQDLGSSLRDARIDYLADTNTPISDPYKQKTLLQFVLLGDPGWS